jgi:dihydrofolate reductase
MRNLVYAINTTLDGCIDHTKFYPEEETMEYFTQLTRDADTFLYGRTTYQLMVPYWPDLAKNPAGDRKADIEFAKAFDAVEKIVVFSRSLDIPEGEKTRIVRSDLQNEVLKLKQEPGKNIFTGGVNLASQLAALGLIDEYHIMVHPIVAGDGRRLFDGIKLQEKLQLKLVGSTVFKSGAVALRYLKK